MESFGVYGFLETFAFQGSGPRATLALGSGGFKVQRGLGGSSSFRVLRCLGREGLQLVALLFEHLGVRL